MNTLFQSVNQRIFGTYPLQGNALRSAMNTALEVGYRAFDTAQAHDNDADIGAVLATSGLRRQDFCLMTKVSVGNFFADKFIPSVEKSLAALKLDYVDVLLLHWPTPGGDISESLELLQAAHDAGLARNIGVSNYNAAMMRQARAALGTRIVTNQVEFHPLLDQSKLLEAANETGIPLSSYCSVARGEILKYPLFAEIGGQYGKSAAQIALRWILQKGVPIVTMSTNPRNIRDNFSVMDFTLSSIDMSRLDDMTRTGFRIVGKDLVPFAPDFD